MKSIRWLTIALLCAAWFLLLFRLDSIPPGFQHDQTFASSNALQVVGGKFPIYFTENFGVGPAHMYAAAAVFRLTGGHYVWALRFTSAILAMLALALTLSFARRRLGPRLALLAGALMAGSYWFLLAGRLGLEAMSLLPLAIACTYCLDRAQERPRLSLYLTAGILGGAAIYTYIASRALFALPAALLIYEAGSVLIARLRGRPVTSADKLRIAGLVAALMVMLAVSAPLLLYIAAHPLVADRRFAELTGSLEALRAGDVGPLLAGIVEGVRALLWDGSFALPYQYNVPGRPVLQPFWAFFFVVGLLASLVRLRDRREFLLLWALALGLAPTLLTSSDAMLMRSIYALPLLYIVAVRGLRVGWEAAGRLVKLQPGSRLERAARAWLPTTAVVALLVWQVADNAQAYFGEWATNERTQRIYNADYRLAASYLDANAGEAEIFIGSDRLIDLDSRTYALYEPQRADVTWFRLPGNPPLPSSGHGVYLGPTTTEIPPALAALTDAGAEAGVIRDAQGRPAMWTVRVSPEALEVAARDARQKTLSPPLYYEDALRLDAVGWRDGGSTGTLVTRWTALGPWPHPTEPGMPLIQPKVGLAITDDRGYRWAQVDAPLALPVHTATPGALLLETTAIPLPADMPPGAYSVTLSLYDDESGSLLVAAGDGPKRRTPLTAATLALTLRPLADPPVPPFPAQPSADALAATGRWEPWERVVAGAANNVHVSWRAAETLATDKLLFRVTLSDPAGAILWQGVEPAPALGGHWEAGRTLRLTHTIAPPEGEPGATSGRVSICAEQGGVELGCVGEEAVAVYTQPAMKALPAPPQYPGGAAFGEALALNGYDIRADGASRDVTLYWQVLEPPSAPLKRFAHLLAADGGILAQSDAPLANGELPPAAWRPGEYIVDRFTLSAPEGQAPGAICIGLYDATTEERVEIRQPTGKRVPDARLCLD